MKRLRWTKFQDFYLRLGFLKTLVAVLDPGRRAVANPVITRRLDELLFSPATKTRTLWDLIGRQYAWYPVWFEEFRQRQKVTRRRTSPYVLEALLVLGDCPSQLYAITKETSYKVLDWAADVGLVAAGNQISEKGLVLRSLLPAREVGSFVSGNRAAWNPFVITEEERHFFLLHLCEIDELTLSILDELGNRPETATIETADAARITCRALFRVLDRAAVDVGRYDLPALRRARDLATVMAEELALDDLATKFSRRDRRIPRPRRVAGRGLSGARRDGANRRTTKNADHQTVPRFEQLVDLGFLVKPSGIDDGVEQQFEAKRKWRYVPTRACRTWATTRDPKMEPAEWAWSSLARTVVQIGKKPADGGHREAPAVLASCLWDAYRGIKRPFGHTPFHSVATIATIRGLASGCAVEMREFHSLMLAIKRSGLAKDYAYFASGNEMDKMFVLLRDGFVASVKRENALLAAQQRGPSSGKGRDTR